MAGNIEQTSFGVKLPTKVEMLTAAVYGYMVHAGGLPDLNFHLANAIMRSWDCGRDLINQLCICGYPSEVANLVLSMEVAKRYGDLDTVPGFYRAGYLRDYWLLDLNPRWSETGFIVPVIDRRFGIYSGLLAFRSPRDMNPFAVEVRMENADGKVAA